MTSDPAKKAAEKILNSNRPDPKLYEDFEHQNRLSLWLNAVHRVADIIEAAMKEAGAEKEVAIRDELSIVIEMVEKERDEFEELVESLTKENVELKKRNGTLWVKLTTAKEQIESLTKEVAELGEKITEWANTHCEMTTAANILDEQLRLADELADGCLKDPCPTSRVRPLLTAYTESRSVSQMGHKDVCVTENAESDVEDRLSALEHGKQDKPWSCRPASEIVPETRKAGEGGDIVPMDPIKEFGICEHCGLPGTRMGHLNCQPPQDSGDEK